MTDKPAPHRLCSAAVHISGTTVVHLPGKTHTPLSALLRPVLDEGEPRDEVVVVFQVAGDGSQRATVRVEPDGCPFALDGFVRAGPVVSAGKVLHAFASWSSPRCPHDPEDEPAAVS